MRRGGRSSIGRWSPWPGLYGALWRLGALVWVSGVPTGIAHGWHWFWGCSIACVVMIGGGALYNRRWQRLQTELFRRRE